VLKITRPEYQFRTKDLLHFTPLLPELGFEVLNPAIDQQQGPIIQLMTFISFGTYLYASYRLIARFYKRLKFNEVSDRYRNELQWLSRFLAGFGLLWLLWLTYALVDYFYYHNQSGMQVYYPLYLFLGIMMNGIATSVFFRLKAEAAAQAPPFKPLLPAELKQKGIWLKKSMELKQFYRDPELTLRSLAETLGLNPNELSRVINSALKKSFNDFINEYRIAEVIRKMQEPAYDRLTLLGIAFDSGFNSKTTFARAFRRVTGKTPGEYSAALKKEGSSYTLNPYSRSAAVVLRHETIPEWSYGKFNRNFMFKINLKIAWRNLVRNKASSFINIGGLAVGMAVTMLIGLWIWDELSFNKYHRNYDGIVQIMQKEKHLGTLHIWDHMPYRLINELKTNYQGDFKHLITATEANNYYLSQGENKMGEKGQYIEAAAPEMLTLKMLSGSWAALNDPHSILLSASAAKRLFGNADPMDKTVKVSSTYDVHNTTDLKVTGIYEDLPQNTQFHETQFFMPWDLYAAADPRLASMAWDDHRFLIYAEFRPGADPDKVSANIKDAELKVIRYLDDMKQEVVATPEILLNPMKNWHLYSNFKDGVADKGSIRFVWIVGIIGCFVLLLACINFMNLSTARSEKRAAEVGIRKAIGSARGQLISQFFSESLLVALLAFMIALLMALLALPLLNDLSAKEIAMPFSNLWFWSACLGFILFTGLLAGLYPALYLSSFQPVKVLKGAFRAGRMASLPRKVLVVVQFTVSIVLIICTIIIYNQLIFGKDRAVGYSRDGLVIVPMQSVDYQGKQDVLRNELKNTGAVAEVAESESPVTAISSNNGGFTWKGKEPNLEEKFGTLTVTAEYGKAIGWQFKDGRDFSKGSVADSSGFVINEAAAKYMGLKSPVGETIHWKSKWNNVDKDYRIIGVIKNMVMESPYDAIKPAVFRLGGNPNWIFIRINPQMSVSNALPKIAGIFKKIVPSVPFTYSFADEDYAKKFAAEDKIGKLTKFFSALAIFISCLGLFGMATFMAEQRTKEIGVRKVMGASVFGLWRLLSSDFMTLVMISFVIAAPVSWYFMAKWLQGYPYRTPISWWVFAVTGVGALVITLLTVSYQSIKAALANPVKSLKTE
jgi:ABC-type antimicrobial peptide transport system permease subunit/AraC-like DNA-binding protein